MSGHHGGIAELLYAASDDAPPSRLDLDLAVRAGRRRRHRRRLIPVVAAFAVLALAAGVAAGVRAAGDHGPVGTPPAPAIPFDALNCVVSVDYQGTDLFLHASTLDARSQTVEFVDQQGGSGRPSIVTLYVPGMLPWEEPASTNWWRPGPYGPSRIRITTEPAPAVGGREARWLMHYGAVISLSWQVARDQWAVVYTWSDPGADIRPVLQDAAAAVRTDVARPLRFPFSVAVPAGWQHVASEVGTLGYKLGFNRSGLPLPGPAYELITQADLSIAVVSADLQGDAFPTTPNATVAGIPAIVSGTVWGGHSVTLLRVAGYRVTVTVRTAAALAELPPQQVEELAMSVAIVGPPGDESRWTTDPLR